MTGSAPEQAPQDRSRVRKPDQVRGSGRLARLGVVAALASRVFGRVVGVLFTFVLARTSPDATVAGYGYLLGTSSLILTISDLGVAAVSGREVARRRWTASAALAAALPIQGVTILGACAVMAGLVVVAKPVGVDTMSLVFTLAFMAANGLVNLWAELIRADGHVVAEAILQAVSPVLLVSAGVVVAMRGGTTADLLAVVAGKELVILLASLVILRPRRRRGMIRARELISSSFTLSVASTAIVLMWRQGAMLTGSHATEAVAAAYIVATRFQDAGATLSSTVGFGLLPGFAAAYEESRAAFNSLVWRYLGRCVAVGLVAGGVGATFADPITLVAFGPRWAAAAPAVRVVALTAPAIMVVYVIWTALLVTHHERWMLWSAVAASVASIAATSYGIAVGAPLLGATLGTALGVHLLVVLLLLRLVPIIRYRPRHGR
ncbi:lipopolysaccharide biosynthesis protein [Arsenicicoccus dermatophilus]|uniref:lipopolysaccharide biosynthesis protein n=1 Tax=Arsenicicoccus dermatophilus TaxID=1076331 RepID=UPI003917556B